MNRAASIDLPSRPNVSFSCTFVNVVAIPASDSPSGTNPRREMMFATSDAAAASPDSSSKVALEPAMATSITATTYISPTSAMHRVLNINELLLNILTRLEMKDIVISTGVCRHWQGVIAADKTAQEKLFLRAATITRAKECVPTTGDQVWDHHARYFTLCDTLDGMNVFNPLLTGTTKDLCGLLSQLVQKPVATVISSYYISSSKMFVTQPPTTLMNLFCKSRLVKESGDEIDPSSDEESRWHKHLSSICAREKADGVRLADLASMIEEMQHKIAKKHRRDPGTKREYIYSVFARGCIIQGHDANANDHLALGGVVTKLPLAKVPGKSY